MQKSLGLLCVCVTLSPVCEGLVSSLLCWYLYLSQISVEAQTHSDTEMSLERETGREKDSKERKETGKAQKKQGRRVKDASWEKQV